MPSSRPSSLRRDLRASWLDGVLFSVMVGLGETYLAPFALALGMSEVEAGLVSTLPMVVGGALQLVAPAAMRLAPSYRVWTVAWVALQAAAFLPLIGASIIGRAPAGLVFAAAALYWGAGMAAAPAWNAWVAAIIPVRVRASFFARRQAAAQVGIVAGLVGGGLVLEATRVRGAALAGFTALFVAALAFRAASAVMLAAHSLPVDGGRPTALSLGGIARRVVRSERRDIVVCLVLVSAAVNLGGPFLTPYLLAENGLSYGAFMAQLACFFVGKTVAYRLLSRAVGRLDLKLLLALGGVGIMPLPLLWLVSSSPLWFAAVQVLSGLSWAAFELATMLSFLDVADEGERTSLLAAYNALNAAAVAAASLVGGALLAGLGGGHAAYATVFVLCAAARLVALVALVYRARREAIIALPALRTIAVRPWGGGVVKPVLATFGLRAATRPPVEAAPDDEPPTPRS